MKEVMKGNLGLSEIEPVWDAADFLRMGKPIARSLMTLHRKGCDRAAFSGNKPLRYGPSLLDDHQGIEWVRRHLAPKGIRVHAMQFNNPKPRHIDDTLIALRPGIAVHSLETPPLHGTLFILLTHLPDGIELFTKSDWRVFTLPHSSFSRSLNINTLSLDDRTVFVEEKEILTQRFFEDLGCRVLVVPFSKVFSLGGSFHCCTTDVRRRGELLSYFPAQEPSNEH
jgi:glycine amidinotransferase